MLQPDKPITGITIGYTCHFQMRRGRKKMLKGTAPSPQQKPKTKPERLPQIPAVSKMLALAHYYQKLLNTGIVKDYAEIAKLTGVTRARLTQIMNLAFLSPDIQQALLCFPMDSPKKTERGLREIAECLSWQEQLERWNS